MKKYAFTLAEVLITLGIIGVVAALTIPTLMQKTNDKEIVSALSKSFSNLSQAYKLAVLENGTPDSWNLGENPERLLTYVIPFLKPTKTCFESGEQCHEGMLLKKRGDSVSSGEIFGYDASGRRVAAVLADGSIIATFSQNVNCTDVKGTTPELQNVCGEFMIDVNGIKSPNVYGKDVFIFNITKNSVIPVGASSYTGNDYKFDTGCLAQDAYGYGCAAWVIYNQNLDYLYCDDLSWNGKTKCD
ncbi:type II secretion system protein [bacterium]|nr:type II secretion system protein [bacterium]